VGCLGGGGGGGAVPSSFFPGTVGETDSFMILVIGLEKYLHLMSIFSACANLALPFNYVLLLTRFAITATAVTTLVWTINENGLLFDVHV